jgi:hypothetical protein
MKREPHQMSTIDLLSAINDGENEDIFGELKKRDEAGRKAIDLVEKIFELSDDAENHEKFAAETLKLMGGYLL